MQGIMSSRRVSFRDQELAAIEQMLQRSPDTDLRKVVPHPMTGVQTPSWRSSIDLCGIRNPCMYAKAVRQPLSSSDTTVADLNTLGSMSEMWTKRLWCAASPRLVATTLPTPTLMLPHAVTGEVAGRPTFKSVSSCTYTRSFGSTATSRIVSDKPARMPPNGTKKFTTNDTPYMSAQPDDIKLTDAEAGKASHRLAGNADLAAKLRETADLLAAQEADGFGIAAAWRPNFQKRQAY